jgi:hypothetical protein
LSKHLERPTKLAGNTLEGFGIVTLASLLPILAVELMAIITSFM